MVAPVHSVATVATQGPMAMVVLVVPVWPELMVWPALMGPLLVTVALMAKLVVLVAPVVMVVLVVR
jgi:hypothetical protein